MRAKSGEVVLQSVMDNRNELVGQPVLTGNRGSVLVEAVSGQKPIAVVEEGAESLQSISELYGKPLQSGIVAVVHGPEGPFGVLCACSEAARLFSNSCRSFQP